MTKIDFPILRANNADLTLDEAGVPIIDTLLKKWNANPSLMLYKFEANGYKFSWLLIPFSIPFVWLLVAWRGRFKAYDHAIFVTYSLSFMSLLFITTSLIAVSPLDQTGGLAFMIFHGFRPFGDSMRCHTSSSSLWLCFFRLWCC